VKRRRDEILLDPAAREIPDHLVEHDRAEPDTEDGQRCRVDRREYRVDDAASLAR